MPRVAKVVLTGGPCAGKTSVLSVLQTTFENHGWKVLTVPETATILFSGGILFNDLNEEERYQFQVNLLRTMLAIENTYFRIAEACEKDTIVFCDRGAVDAFAYQDKKYWDRMEGEDESWNLVEMRDSRYDCCVHLVSAAIGAEKFYQTDNNTARKEGLELARFLDNLVSKAWLGHPYHSVIDNSTGFKEKLQRVVSAVTKHLHLDYPDSKMILKRKFLIDKMPAEFPVPIESFDIEHDYMKNAPDGTQARIRKRGQNGKWTYTHTVRQKPIDGMRVEVKRNVKRREYTALHNNRDKTHQTAVKLRTVFFWEGNAFYIDEYQAPTTPQCEGLILMECYCSKEADLKLPGFLSIVKEVTKDAEYSMYDLTIKK